MMPEEKFAFDYFIFNILEAYYQAGEFERAREISNLFADRLDEQLAYYRKFKGDKRSFVQNEVTAASQYYGNLLNLMAQYDPEVEGNDPQNTPLFKRYVEAISPFRG